MLTTFSGRNPSQNEFELNSFIALLKERGVMRYLEIGARHGDTFHAVMKALPAGSYGVAVDLPGGLWGTAKSRIALTRAVADINCHGRYAFTLFGDSHTPLTAEHIHSMGPFDAVLIDGDHTLPGVTCDWQLYGNMAPLIAFHDIVGTGQCEKVSNNPVEVPVLWEAIKEQALITHEFIAPGSLMGIGVVEHEK